jgi:hypothetical protein
LVRLREGEEEVPNVGPGAQDAVEGKEGMKWEVEGREGAK